MEGSGRRFSSDEVTSIVRRALEGGGTHQDVNIDELEEIAEKSGVSVTRLREAIEEEDSLGSFERAKDEYRAKLRQEFFQHFRSYCIVNVFLLLVNLVTSPGILWFIWPVMGWGIGLAFHAFEALYASEADIEKGTTKMLRRRERKRARRDYKDRLTRDFFGLSEPSSRSRNRNR